jgi:demethylmenaquinone methyltransferase/2-methoxy-6-polyprenyl-1,4-benzoquinol methylase
VSSPILRVFQSRAQTRAFYNRIARVYDLLSDRSEAPLRRAGLELLRAAAGERILEIGFGTGHCLVAIAKAIGPTGRAFGLDLSNAMLKLARHHLARAGLSHRVRLRCGDAAQLPYAAGSMDAVFMSFTLELFDTPEIPIVLRECRRVLRPRYRIVIVGLSKDSSPDPLLGIFEWAHKPVDSRRDCARGHVLTQRVGCARSHLIVSLRRAKGVSQWPAPPPCRRFCAMNAETISPHAGFKFNCPSCGQHIRAAAPWVGLHINCPACHTRITIPSRPGGAATPKSSGATSAVRPLIRVAVPSLPPRLTAPGPASPVPPVIGSVPWSDLAQRLEKGASVDTAVLATAFFRELTDLRRRLDELEKQLSAPHPGAGGKGAVKPVADLVVN